LTQQFCNVVAYNTVYPIFASLISTIPGVMTKYHLTLLLFSIPFLLSGQNSLHGNISDATDHSMVIGATVYIPDLKKGTVTNIDGAYTIDNLPRGKFLIEVKYIGYASVVQTVLIDGLTEFNLELSSTITELNEVVVTGISHSSELRNNPIPITTIDNTRLTENTSTNLIDNIAQKKGVSQITTGAAVSKPVIRGLSYNRIISLYDGIRQEGQQWGDEHGIEIDEFSVDRVEVIKGAGSLMYGSDGLGGVINFLAANPVAEGSITGKWISNYQTNNGLIANSVLNAGNIKGIYWQVRASNKIAKAYRNPYDGKVFNSGFHENDLNGFLGISKSWGYAQVNVSSFNQDVGLVEGERDASGKFTRLKNINDSEEEVTASDNDLSTYKLFVPRQTINHLRITNSTNIYVGSARIQLNVGYQRNQRKEYGDVLDENLKNLYFDLNTLNYNLIAFLPEKNQWQFSLGTSGMSQQNENKGIEFLIPEYRSFDWGAFGFFKRSFGKLELAGGVRFDQRKLSVDALYLDENGNPTTDKSKAEKFVSADLSFENYSYSAGVTYQFLKRWSAKFNASRGYRAPNISELASNGRHEGSLRYEYGNYNLKPETSFQIDGGLVFHSKHASVELSVFQNTINDYIYAKKLLSINGTDSISDPGEPVPAYQYVQGKAQLTGGEFSVDLHPHPFDWLHFENAFSFVNALNRSQANDSAKYLPFMPAPRYQSELRANIKVKKSVLRNAFIKFEYNHHWRQDRVLLENRTETVTPSYSLCNAGIGTDIVNTKGETIVSFYCTVNNLFDKAYQNHLSRLKYAAENSATGRIGVFNMGRNISFKVVVPIAFKKAKSSAIKNNN
jgi:iron complex outermembrane recepter protein